jgi:hypothetical protein
MGIPPYKQVAIARLKVDGMNVAETDAVPIAFLDSRCCLRD